MSSSKSDACPDDKPSSRTGIEVCIFGPDEWYEPSFKDISDSRSAESQSVISGERVKSFEGTWALLALKIDQNLNILQFFLNLFFSHLNCVPPDG